MTLGEIAGLQAGEKIWIRERKNGRYVYGLEVTFKEVKEIGCNGWQARVSNTGWKGDLWYPIRMVER